MTIALVLQYSNKGAQNETAQLHKLITLEQIPQIRVKNSDYIHVNEIAIKN